MGVIERVVLIKGLSTSHTTTGVARVQQTRSPTSSSSSSPLPTVRIQQATVSQSQPTVRIQQATISQSQPTVRIQQATISQSQQFTIASDTTMIIQEPTASASTPPAPANEQQGLSPSSIAGLAMIPVAVLLIAVGIFTFFWLRKHRRRGPVIRHLSPSGGPPPTLPDKDFGSPASSFDSVNSGGKVRNMSAMSTPIVHPGWVSSQRSQPRPSHDSAVHHNPWRDQLPKTSTDITTAELQVPPRGAVEAGNDSPIDRSSPFRLKRGDTQRRSSLDPTVMSAWPAPPPPAAQPAPFQPSRVGMTYMERRSISAEYFAQERDNGGARGAQQYWESMQLELGSDPGPTFKSR